MDRRHSVYSKKKYKGRDKINYAYMAPDEVLQRYCKT